MKDTLNDVKFITTTEIANEACRIANEHDISPNAVSFLTQNENDNRVFWNNYLVSDFIKAALHLIGIKKYNGDRQEVLDFMKVGLMFE